MLDYKRLAIRYIKVAAYSAIGIIIASTSTITNTATLIVALRAALIAGLIAVLHKAQKELKS